MSGTPGRVCLVTGGSRGIGLAVARRLQSSGHRVAITYRMQPPSPLEGGPGTNPLLALECDVTSPDDVESAFTAIEATLGPVEVLVCAAGITDDALLVRMGEERWAQVIETDLTACYRTVKRAMAPMMRARFGRVVLVSSVVALSGNPGQTNYAAAKAGLIGFGRSLAREVASRQVTVNVVAPGLIETEMIAGFTEAQREAFVSQIPLGRAGSADEVAGAIAYLCGDEAAYVTGSILAIDGGLGMGY